MEKNNEEVALFVAQSGPLNGQRWSLHETLILGRDGLCDIVIPDRQVSRHHARLTPTSEGVQLEDLHSKNGTHLNGKPIETAVLLQDGDSIQIALAQSFVFLSSDATIPLEPDYSSLRPIQQTTDQQQLGEIIPTKRLQLDRRSHRVWIRVKEHSHNRSGRRSVEQEVEIDPPLSASQFRMLEILYDQEGQVVARQDLISGVWGIEEAIGVSEQALDALIRRLRDRLASVDPSHAYLVTVRGHGLRLENPPVEF